MIKHLVIADDLSGAFKIAVQYAKQGITTAVTFYTHLNFNNIDDSVEVLVIDTESRLIKPHDAFKRVKAVLEKALNQNINSFYKKTNSILSSNIGSELDAVMRYTNTRVLPFIPDLTTAITLNDIATIINQHTNLDSQILMATDNYDLYRFNSECVCIFEAEDNETMHNIAEYIATNNRITITAGCAGFANVLINYLPLTRKDVHQTPILTAPFLAVCGSINETSLKQLNYAKQYGFSVIELTTEQKLSPSYCYTIDGHNFIDTIADKLKLGKPIILSTADTDKNSSRLYALHADIPANMIPFVISENLSTLVKKIMDHITIGSLMVSGGETAIKIINKLQYTDIEPVCEPYTGTIISKVQMQTGNYNLITKSGGLGSESLMVDVFKLLQ